jgi:signal peptidase II
VPHGPHRRAGGRSTRVRVRLPPPACLAAAAVVMAADQTTKWLVRRPSAGLPRRLFDGVRLDLFHNYGVSFSTFSHGGTVLKAGVAAVTLVVCAVWLLVPRRLAWPLAFVAAGSLSNLIDRLRWGYVIDFVNVAHWPTFNIADAAIVAGAVVTAALVVFQR